MVYGLVINKICRMPYAHFVFFVVIVWILPLQKHIMAFSAQVVFVIYGNIILSTYWRKLFRSSCCFICIIPIKIDDVKTEWCFSYYVQMCRLVWTKQMPKHICILGPSGGFKGGSRGGGGAGFSRAPFDSKFGGGREWRMYCVLYVTGASNWY